MKYTYGSGQRPLDGYVIKRGVGKGGFGEVYFALSEGGKEVALKLLRNTRDNEAELRGVAQCLNLKHPNLVSLYDLRTDAQGDHWVVMEYVAGEPLNTVINRHPNGLPTELARQWFIDLCKATAHLHDHGIVHRDLKPGNIFLENGTVKVGDYGLSKFIGGSQRTAQTQSVGTVHYMAPEISTGNYGKGVDVYAAGIILYEMLTGRVPFDGESAGEILMKHLTSPPDLSKLPPVYLPIVAKALSKNPAHRYSTMTELARAVETVGTNEAKPVPVMKAVETARPAPAPTPAPAPRVKATQEAIPLALPAVTFRSQIAELAGSMALATVLSLLGTTLWEAVVLRSTDLAEIGTYFFMAVATSWVVLLTGKVFAQSRGDNWRRRTIMMCMGVLVALLALWITGWMPHGTAEAVTDDRDPWCFSFLPPGTGLAEGAGYVSYFALVFFALRWWRIADPRRGSRFSFLPVLATGFWSVVPIFLFGGSPLAPGAVALLLTSVVVQIVSPWEAPLPPAARRLRLRHVC